MWSGCISTHPNGRWCCAWTRKPDPGPGPIRANAAHASRRTGPQTFDYVRLGTTSLFAALELASGTVISSLKRRHRHQEFLAFLRTIDRQTPADLDIHLILDNYATHKTPAVPALLPAHPRFHLHFTPTGAGWLNLVERFFAEITVKLLRRGVHRSVSALETDTRTWIEQWNANPRPYIWTRTADEILESLAAYCTRVNDSGH